MSTNGDVKKKLEPQALMRRVKVAARTAKKSAKAVIATKHTLAPPVEIEPRPVDVLALRALQKERRRLLEELRRQEMLAQDRPTTGNHMADDASEVEAQAKSLALRRHLEGMIKEIDRAIARAEKGMYGICERCKNPIAEERLKVMPAATLCIECAKLQTRPMKVATAV
ncbi:MAG: TraR/DksA C4-type zinc finger protein [Anaerolineae bacterium]|nr:TraR/DksA C4-type zinc finger protein [Anaerolineae bacterium]